VNRFRAFHIQNDQSAHQYPTSRGQATYLTAVGLGVFTTRGKAATPDSWWRFRSGGAREHSNSSRRRGFAPAGTERDRPRAGPVPVDHPHGPAAAVAFSIIFAVTYAGGATPLADPAGACGRLFCAISIGQLAAHLPSAGGLYTYNARP